MQLVTGNRLRDGVVVYYAGAGQWSPAIDAALLVEDSRAETLLAEAQQGPAPLPAVGIEVIEATREAGQVCPASLRERIRAFGPTTGPMANRRAVDATRVRSQ